MFDYSEVTDIVDSLDDDFETVREQAYRRYDLYRMQHEPYVPEEIAREGKVRVLSPLVMYAAQTIRSDIMMNPTEFTVIPLARERDGTISQRMETKAEALERALAILWGQLNEGRRIDREIIWHQLVSPFGIIMLEFNELQLPDQPDEMPDDMYLKLIEYKKSTHLPWHLYLPDPMTCSWIERDGRPLMFARRYKVLVKDILDSYNHNTSSVEPDAHLAFENNKFKWVSDDYDPDRNSHLRNSQFEEVEIKWLDDGLSIYQCVLNPHQEGRDDDGLMLSCIPNPTGRPTGFVVPGNITPDRDMENRYEPFLLPLMQSVNQINDLRSMRATAARNLAGPHTYVAIDPEIQKIYLQRGEKLPSEVRWKKNVTHYLLGEVKEIPSEVSADWDKIEQMVNEEKERFLPSPFVNVIDPAVLKSATATSILHAAEAGMRMYGPIMSAYDAVIRDIMESVLASVSNGYYDEPVPLYATGLEVAHGRPVSEGSFQQLAPDSIDFGYKILVRTHGMSQAQAAAQYQSVLAQYILPDGSKGPATKEDLIDAANYTDPVAQKMKLAKEAILDAVDPWLIQMATMKTRDKIYVDSGIPLPMGGAPTQPEETPSRLPNQAQRMDSPNVAGPEGGSSPITQ